jgi:chemotaxis protein CheX
MVTTESLKGVVMDSAQEVFQSMVNTSIEESPSSGVPGDAALLASITFKGNIEGCLGIHCDPPCAQRIAGGMLCADGPVADGEMVDALGEVANLLMGGVKTRVLEEVKELQISIPSVVQGRQLKSHMTEGTTRIGIPVKIGGDGMAELSLLFRMHCS